jgi:capsule polysaccharide export protein KpsE/RkpR
MSSESKLSSTIYSTGPALTPHGTPTNGHDRVLELNPSPATRMAKTLLQLWMARRFVAKAAVIGLVFATVAAFIMRPRYDAFTRLMPPEKSGLAALAELPLLAGGGGGDEKDSGGGAGALAGGLVSSALGLKSSGALLIGVLRSRTVEDRMIDKFDLLNVYHCRYYKNAREKLEDATDIQEDRKSGIITITVEDKSPQRAADMARAYDAELNSMLARLSTSAAGKERAFIEERLKTVKSDLDQATTELSQFSSQNTTLDVKEQAKAMVESAANLQGELISSEAYLSSLEQIYTENNVRVHAARAKVTELRKQLAGLRGSAASAGDDPANANTEDLLYPSIRRLPILGIKYADLYRKAKIQEVIFEVLSKQYEMAKIQEAKELPTVRVLDEPKVPERKARPHRLLIMLGGLFLGAFFASSYVVGHYTWESLPLDHPAKAYGLMMGAGVADDIAALRARLPRMHRNGHSRKDEAATVDESRESISEPNSGK